MELSFPLFYNVFSVLSKHQVGALLVQEDRKVDRWDPTLMERRVFTW